ncbi:MAG: tetratricopeptide repeat protein [Clostridia bacterium]|nr:tetratricopeptide repeat protein [Clostridia bacterium]
MKDNKYINPFSKNSENLAKEFDSATISKDTQKIESIIKKAMSLVKTEDNASKAAIFYSLGTAFGDLQSISKSVDEELIKKQLYYFRKSLKIIESDELNKTEYTPYVLTQKILLYTNYANVLDACGRKIAAIEYLKKAIEIHNDFGMALGNLGRIYQRYGELDFDEERQEEFHYFACKKLYEACESNDPNTHLKAKKYFKKMLEKYPQDFIDDALEGKMIFNKYSYPDPDELSYRSCCLQKGLFLNPANDLPVLELAFAGDTIQLPKMIVKVHDKPIFHGMFSQLKQEYIYARILYYEALNSNGEVHFADRETYIVSYTDYTQYCIRVEKLKTSFKTLYGMFDKIAFFIEHYFCIGIKERDVNFKTIWRKSAGHGKNEYLFANPLNPKNNIALYALYWISKDFFEKFEDSPNPKLIRISNIRNALEHKYVKVTSGFFNATEEWEDGLALYVRENELYDITLELLKILREAIICLAFCVNIEEIPKREDAKGKLILPMSLMDFEDEWKV